MAAGSFSVFLNELASVTRNLFHIVELEPSLPGGDLHGLIRTWEFNYGTGWDYATQRSAGLPHYVQLGPQPRTHLAEVIKGLVRSARRKVLSAVEVARSVPDLEYLLSDELASLRTTLRDEWQIKMDLGEYGEPVAFAQVHPTRARR
jgi:hypothetical protein